MVGITGNRLFDNRAGIALGIVGKLPGEQEI
jgi:hypothetical protein